MAGIRKSYQPMPVCSNIAILKWLRNKLRMLSQMDLV